MFLFRHLVCKSLLKNMRHYNLESKMGDVEKKLIIYGDEASPPVRFVLMTASILGVNLDFQKIDIFKSENKTEFYKKINPLQKVPALSVNGNIIRDSHAIALYLCQKSGHQELYPEDALTKADIDQMLFFNSSTLFPIDSAIFTEYFAGKWPVDEIKIEEWNSSLDYLELRLNKHAWLAGDKVRLCDLCCGTTVSSLTLLVPVSKRHKRVEQWLNNLETLSSFDINRRGLKRLEGFIEMMKSNF